MSGRIMSLMVLRATALLVCLAGLSLFASHADASKAGTASYTTYIQARQTESNRSTVYGRAVYSDTQQPVGHASIVLRNMARYADPADLTGSTNGRGEFRITGVPAGRYFIGVNSTAVVSPEAFLNSDDNAETLFYMDEMREYFDEVEVNGKTDKQVLVRARRGAVITGKVTYANGEPAVNHPVTILRRRGNRYSMFWTNVSYMRQFLVTDDRGMYRVPGLPAAEYIVGATSMLQHGESVRDDALEANMIGSMLAMTFHPATPLVTQATAVRVATGEERTGIDVTLAEREMHRMSGVVRARDDDRPIARARVHIIRKETYENVSPTLFWPYSMGMPGVTTDELGRWRLTLLPDGKYILIVKPPQIGSPGLELEIKRYDAARKEIEISGADVNNVLLEVGGNSKVSGTITVENAPLPPNIDVSLQPDGVDEESLVEARAQRGKFVIDNVPPGKMYFLIGLQPESPPFYLKSITWNGKDLLREPLEVGVETSIDGVAIVLSPRVATFNIRVRTSAGQPARDAEVTFVSSDPARWNRKEAQLFCTTDINGKCTIVSAPGEYLVFILPSGVEGSTLQKHDIQERAARQQRVSLQPGERGTFDLVLPRDKQNQP